MELSIKPDLSGKVAVVTGGAGVLGSYFSESLAACGAKVAILGRNLKKAEDLALELTKKGYQAIGVSADVVSKDSLEKAHQMILNTFGKTDILINCAGGNDARANTTDESFEKNHVQKEGHRSFFDLDLDGFNHVFGLNFIGSLLPSQVFGLDMIDKKGATIINISSMSGLSPLTKIPAYSAAKAAISNFTQWMSVHFAKEGIRVNSIAPGFFSTEQNKTLLWNEDGTPTARSHKIISQTPMGRFGNPEELIGALLWLSCEKSSGFVTGIVLPVDGGFSAYSGV